MTADVFKEKLQSCVNEIGSETIRVVSDNYHITIHNITDVRVNKNNQTIEIVIGKTERR